MNQLKQIFEYQCQLVRTVIRNGEPWFVAKDICDILDIMNPTDALKSLDEDERASFNLGRQGNANIINEPGLYSLVLRSRKPEAKAFKRWVTHEVLPSIRKTGQYNLRNNPNAVLRRHLATATTLSKGLPHDKQLELRRLAVLEAAEESGADYSKILQVLGPSPAYTLKARREASATLFIDTMIVEKEDSAIKKYDLRGAYICWCAHNAAELASETLFNDLLQKKFPGVQAYKREWHGIHYA